MPDKRSCVTGQNSAKIHCLKKAGEKAPKVQSPKYNNRTLSTNRRQTGLSCSPDKVRISTENYHISDAKNLTLHQAPVPATEPDLRQPYLFTDKAGKDYLAQKAVLNTDQFNLTIYPDRLVLQFNPNKVLHAYQLATGRTERNKAIDLILVNLRQAGIDADFEQARLSRLDLAKQDKLRYPLLIYHPVLSGLKGTRKTNRQYGDSYYYANKSIGSVVYDKGNELNMLDLQNLIRLEHQAKNSDAVNRHFKLITLQDLKDAEPDFLNDGYNTYLRNHIFRYNTGNDLKRLSADQYLKHLAGAESRFISKFINYLGCQVIPELYGSVESFCKRLEPLCSRQHIHKVRHEINRQILEQQQLMNSNRPSVQDLYAELYRFAC